MEGKQLLDRLLTYYQGSYDITRPFAVGGDLYDAFAAFNATNTKYVLVKKAELWQTKCFEYVLFRHAARITSDDVDRFRIHTDDTIEPDRVLKGQALPEENHMYSFITGIFISDEPLSEETVHSIKKFKFHKEYKMGFRGYCEGKLMVFDMSSGKIISNRAGRDMIKDYKKAFKPFYE